MNYELFEVLVCQFDKLTATLSALSLPSKLVDKCLSGENLKREYRSRD